MIKISPSILSADFCHLARDIQRVEEAGADYLHVDVMDGHFVPNLTIGPPVVACVKGSTKLPLDVHLMIDNPDLYLEDYVKAGADLLGVHVEACTHLHRTLSHIRELGARPVVTLNPHTPLCMVESVLELVDMVLIMSVNPGFGGQAFIESSVPKVAALREMISRQGLEVMIEVDGGIKEDTIGRVVAAGADVLVSGSGIFGHPEGCKAAVAGLRRAAEG